MGRRDREERRERDDEYGSAREGAKSRSASGAKQTITPPEGMQSFSIKKEGTYRIDILPYRVGVGNPFMKEGKLYFERTFYSHKRLGPNKTNPPCPARNKNKPCPACEMLADLDRDPNAKKENKDALFCQRKQLFLVLDHSDLEAGPKLWEIAYHNFGKQLDARINASDEDDGYDKFFYADERGFTLKLGASEDTTGENKYIKVTSIDFKKREKPLSSKMLAKLPCLDELVDDAIPKYKELEALLGEDSSGDADEDEPRGKRRPKDDDDEDDDRPLTDDEEFDDEEDEDEPKRGKKKKGKRDEDDDDEDDPPFETKGKKKKKPKDDDDEDDEDDDD